jgi:hypothetical protein
MNPEFTTKVPVLSPSANTDEKMLPNISHTNGKSLIKHPSPDPYKYVDLKSGDKDKSRVTILIEIGEHLEKFHDPNGDAYAVIVVNEHCEVWQLNSREFRDWLSYQYFQLSGKGTDRKSVSDALSTLTAIARHRCEKRSVFRRVAGDDKTIYIDLCDEAWRVIEVNASGYQILDKPPVMFVRNKGMVALPDPSDKGSIDDLWKFLNIDDKDKPLVLAFIVAAFRPLGPYPILVLLGEQGTAKSTLSKLLRMLIDPSTTLLRSPPKDERDFLIGAINNWLLNFDNLSGMRPWLSDGLCRMATGGGFATRELYTDTNEILVDLKRPAIVNGIDDLATRQDFAERSILLHLHPIQDDRRVTEKKLMKAFWGAHANILGGIMKLLSSAICNIDSVSLASQPRMADFAQWVEAAGIAGFLDAYNDNQNAVTSTGLHASPVGSAVMDLIDLETEWKGTMAELHRELENYTDDEIRATKAWPKSATWLSNYLRRLGSSLRKLGIDVTLPEQATDHQVHIKKTPRPVKIADIAELPAENNANEQNQQNFPVVGNGSDLIEERI